MNHLLLLVLVSLGCESVCSEGAQKYDQTWRFPIVAIPKIERAPEIDGTISDQEWANATLFPSLLSRDPLAGDGVPPKERTWVWMCYSDEALYWAFRQDLPPQELPVQATAESGRDNTEGSDNTVNIQFTTRIGIPEQFNISGNAASILYDRRFDNGEGKYWDPPIVYKATTTPAGWSGEMKIPFKVLDLENAPAEGSQWNC
ncbi:MAG: hypothetical protein O3B01_14130 [Planctomycetota bacterium]|nr:hypothetical protein [Planctomycetota bacterium]MDA1139708.1 hypothetical protein [Planctomycetota bacterium]